MLDVKIDKNKEEYSFHVNGNAPELVSDMGVLLFQLRKIVREQGGKTAEEIFKLMLMRTLDFAFSEEVDELMDEAEKEADKINDNNEEALDIMRKWLEE